MKRAGRAKGKSKGADEIFSVACQKAAADKEVGWSSNKQLEGREAERGDTLQVGTIVRLNWALIQVCTKALKKGQGRWTEARSEEGTWKKGS